MSAPNVNKPSKGTSAANHVSTPVQGNSTEASTKAPADQRALSRKAKKKARRKLKRQAAKAARCPDQIWHKSSSIRNVKSEADASYGLDGSNLALSPNAEEQNTSLAAK
ncbi:hypothetical protein OPT61_g10632 [Boeremia exigua]|uniref:Uncharacterized protein n=1 Tax=Boeremia exigua TaxID=749465 RepID=A0ACC2HP53_9PLEO|nr:hypothetical protein OPT61_g10632 [Boeremia exigua]